MVQVHLVLLHFSLSTEPTSTEHAQTIHVLGALPTSVLLYITSTNVTHM